MMDPTLKEIRSVIKQIIDEFGKDIFPFEISPPIIDKPTGTFVKNRHWTYVGYCKQGYLQTAKQVTNANIHCFSGCPISGFSKQSRIKFLQIIQNKLKELRHKEGKNG